MANDGNHKVYFYANVTGGKAQAILDAIGYYDTNTDAVVYEYPLFYDVTIQIGSFPTIQALAWGQCNPSAQYGASDPNRWCVSQYIMWNTFFESTHYSTQAKKAFIGCHELGHTLGLRHTSRTTTCMRTATIVPNFVPTTKVLDSHDTSHINTHY